MGCRICNNESVTTVYDGEIRSGGIYSDYTDKYVVKRCKNCSVEFLHPFDDNLTENYDYESKEYWDNHHGSIDATKLQKEHDPEQLRWLSEIGVNEFRNTRVADFGCAAGQFLDLLHGVANKTIGVDPATHFRQHLERNGHKYKKYPRDLTNKSVDIGVSFDTLEHIQNPIEFLVELYNSISEGGELYIAVPNQDDILKDAVPSYKRFFYHKSHLFYYDSQALRTVLNTAGFEIAEIKYVHKYNLMNLVIWARDNRPGGHENKSVFDDTTETAFQQNIEQEEKASHILVKASK